jgi:hypothetical protein
LRPAWATQQDPVSKKPKQNQNNKTRGDWGAKDCLQAVKIFVTNGDSIEVFPDTQKMNDFLTR